MDPLLQAPACEKDAGKVLKSKCSTKMGLDDAFSELGWGQDAWPSEHDVRKRHRELMLLYHPDKAPAGKEEEYHERASRANRAKEIILRAQGLSPESEITDSSRWVNLAAPSCRWLFVARCLPYRCVHVVHAVIGLTDVAGGLLLLLLLLLLPLAKQSAAWTCSAPLLTTHKMRPTGS